MRLALTLKKGERKIWRTIESASQMHRMLINGTIFVPVLGKLCKCREREREGERERERPAIRFLDAQTYLDKAVSDSSSSSFADMGHPVGLFARETRTVSLVTLLVTWLEIREKAEQAC